MWRTKADLDAPSVSLIKQVNHFAELNVCHLCDHLSAQKQM